MAARPCVGTVTTTLCVVSPDQTCVWSGFFLAYICDMKWKIHESIGWIIIGGCILFLAALPSILVILHDINAAK